MHEVLLSLLLQKVPSVQARTLTIDQLANLLTVSDNPLEEDAIFPAFEA